MSGRLRQNSQGVLNWRKSIHTFYFLFPADPWASPKWRPPIPFRMAVVSQLCFSPSRPCHHHSSRSNSRMLAHLSVDIGPSRHLSPSKPQPSSHPLDLLSSYRSIVLSSCSKAQSPPLGWQSLTLGNLTVWWLLLQGTSINATKSLRDRNIRPINTKPSTRS
jgi:hypothetical protein